MTLQHSLDTRDNALNFVRLVFAGLVIVSHAWPLGGFGTDPKLGDLNLGSWAVAGFFAISGYLITESRMKLSLRQFAIRRGLRIYPGLWVSLIVVAFVFAPLAALGRGVPFVPSSAARFVWSNATTVLAHMRIGSELASVPFADSWDGPLWTLELELACYVGAGLVLSLGWARKDLVRTTVGVYVALIGFNLAFSVLGATRGAILFNLLSLASYFAAGSLLCALRDQAQVNRLWVAASVCALGLFATMGVVDLLGALPLAYLVLAFGGWCPVRWGLHRDLSYGVYIYAWPVQQMLALARVQRFGPVVFIAAAGMLVLPLAWLSWTFVEHPAMRHVHRRSAPTAGVEATTEIVVTLPEH